MVDLEQKVRELSQLKPGITIFYTILDWLLIAMTITLCHQYFSWPLYILTIMIIGGRMHSLGIMSHDVVHFRFMKNRSLADWLGNIFMTWPLFFTVPGFRSMHLRHHSKLNSDQDPDWTRRKGKDDWSYPMRPSKLGRILLMDTTGLNLYQNILKLLLPAKDKKLRSDFEKQPRLYYLAMLAFYILIFSVITLTGSWKSFFLYWLVPYFTWLKFIKRLRAVAEHFAIPAGNFQQVTRTTLVNPLTAFFIAPKYINFHAEHHHWPSIPWYHLRQMHEYLQQTNAMPGYGYISSGYFTGVLKECTQECQLCKLNP